MRQAFLHILGYFPKHWKQDFNWGYYLTVLVFLGICTGLNYGLLPDVTLERWITRRYFGTIWCVPWYIFFYGIPYYGTLLLHSLFQRDWSYWRKRSFWVRSSLAIVVLSVDACFYIHRLLIDAAAAYPVRYVWYKWLGNAYSIISVGIPLFLFWWWRDRNMQIGWYGLRRKGFDWRPYGMLLLLMVPLVITAAYSSDFLSYYPTLKMKYVRGYDLLPPGWILAIYEFLYISDFVWTELIFRGFMVLGIGRVLGATAIVPMCSVYGFRHFAKPMGEAISSVFGGYILGVIAWQSRNILGGVWVHMGIALLMEVMAILIKGWVLGADI